MSSSVSAFAYIIASICFIMALRGLSSPVSARRGNMFAIAGMVIAVVATLVLPQVMSFGTILAGIVIGGAAGTVIARRIEMTALPQLVAAFHSLVGLAAVFVAAAAFSAPETYGIGTVEDIKTSSLIEMSIGAAIGAITFTGSIIAFGKLQGILSGKPVTFGGQHLLNLVLGIVLVLLVVWFVTSESGFVFFLIVLLSLLIGVLISIPISSCRSRRGGSAMRNPAILANRS